MTFATFFELSWFPIIWSSCLVLCTSGKFRLINSYTVPCTGFYIAEVISRLIQTIDPLSVYQWEERTLCQTTIHLYYEKELWKIGCFRRGVAITWARYFEQFLWWLFSHFFLYPSYFITLYSLIIMKSLYQAFSPLVIFVSSKILSTFDFCF